jgi:hypothetical protein
MDKPKEIALIPLPGFFIAVIDDSQMENVNFKGDDRFDLPQTGMLAKLTNQDTEKVFDDEKGTTYGALVGRRVSWAKYAESDCLIFDNGLQKDIVIISLEKLRGYE